MAWRGSGGLLRIGGRCRSTDFVGLLRHSQGEGSAAEGVGRRFPSHRSCEKHPASLFYRRVSSVSRSGEVLRTATLSAESVRPQTRSPESESAAGQHQLGSLDAQPEEVRARPRRCCTQPNLSSLVNSASTWSVPVLFVGPGGAGKTGVTAPSPSVPHGFRGAPI